MSTTYIIIFYATITVLIIAAFVAGFTLGRTKHKKQLPNLSPLT